MYMKKITILLLACVMAAGCAALYKYQHHGSTARDIRITELAEMLNDSLRRPALKNKEIGILTFVNLNNLEEAEPLGRHIQEQLSHELFELGFRVIEIRLGKNIRFQPLVGELNLTRVIELLKQTEFPEIESFVVGTYLDAGDYVYVNARIVEVANSTVKGSGEIKIPKGEYLSRLLNMQEDGPTETEVFERFPVKTEKTQ